MNNQRKLPQEVIPCPGCSGTKLKGMALCHNCKKQYVAEAADIALTGKPVSTYEEWIENRVKSRIPLLEASLKTAQANLSAIQKKAEERLQQLLTERISGQDLASEILEAAKAKLKEKEGSNIWKAIGGDGAYRESKIATARIQEARRLLKDLGVKKTPVALLKYGEQILQQKK